MVDDFMVNKELGKIKEIISIEKFDDTMILINTDDKLSHDITLKRYVKLITCAIKNGNIFYPELFSDHTLYNK